MVKRFVCEGCCRKFLYAATKTTIVSEVSEADCSTNAVPKDSEFASIEFRCCPYCGSLDFDEIREEPRRVIDRVKLSDSEEIRDKLGQGWTIVQEWSKETLMYLYEESEGDYVKDALAKRRELDDLEAQE